MADSRDRNLENDEIGNPNQEEIVDSASTENDDEFDDADELDDDEGEEKDEETDSGR